jgi:YidC/Oxa1 family membrane protein insertase
VGNHYVACGPHHGAGFLFISDLTNKAKGATLIVLIVLYVGTQLASTLMMSSPTMDQTQRRLFMLMPLFFVIFIINFPSGVIVYWITTNLWTMGQQYFVKKTVHAPAAAGAGPPGGGGGGPGGGRAGRPGGRDSGGPEGLSGDSADGGGLRERLLGKPKAEDKVPVATGSRRAAPPPPPRKKKKRSGRRR